MSGLRNWRASTRIAGVAALLPAGSGRTPRFGGLLPPSTNPRWAASPPLRGGAEAAGFEEVDDRVGHPALAQAIGGGQHLLELVGVHRREHDLLAGDVLAGPGEPDRAFGKQLRAFRWREQGRNLAAFGYHEGPQLSIGLKHASQHGRRRVRVGHEHDAGDVAGLGEHGLGHGRVLVGALVLAFSQVWDVSTRGIDSQRCGRPASAQCSAKMIS